MAEELKKEIAALGDVIRAKKSNKEDVGTELTKLLALKADYKSMTGEDYVAPGQVKKPKEKKDTTPKEKKEAGPKKEKANTLTPEQQAQITAQKEAKAKAKAEGKKVDPGTARASASGSGAASIGDIAAEVQKRKGTALERTYIMIKPDGVQRNLIGEIIERFERRGFRLAGLKMKRPPRVQLETHYADLSSKPFFPGLIEYMSSAPVVCMVWEGLDAVTTGRKMLGETKPLESLPGTIRGDLCLDIGRNICHGSDSVESAEKEIALWFDRSELCSFDMCSTGWIYEMLPSTAAASSASHGQDTVTRPRDGDKFYITTAINYTNGPPHMGHAYEAITTDAIARYHRIYGRKVFFLTGTDEHGEKIATTAESQGLKPIDICNKWADQFQALNARLNVSNDFYIRTSMDKHKKLAQLIYTKAKESGDIYKGEYEGWYNPKEEAFVTENEAMETNYKDPSTGNDLIKRKEASYFFKQSKYQKRLVEYIHANPHFIMPEIRRNEILARLNDELRDLSISRTTFAWGIPLPDDPKHVMYVWFDALTNYLSGIDYPGGPNCNFWPANVQIIGKDIVWFHCVIWPCMLMSAGIELPTTVFAHGFVNDANNVKMSKSLGNVIDPNKILDKYPSDAMRYFLMRESAYGTDLPFSEMSLIERFNTELADTFGNAVHRGVNLCVKYTEGVVPDVDVEKPFDLDALRDANEKAFSQVRIHEALEATLAAVRELNKYLTDREPWKMKDPKQERERATVVRTVLECAFVLTHFLDPYLPKACAAVIDELHTPLTSIKLLSPDFKNLKVGTKVHVGEVLFKKIEKPKAEKPIQTADLRVACILDAKPHPAAPTLWILQERIESNAQIIENFKN